MLNPLLEDVLDKGDSRYSLVMLTAKRARQIIDGSESLIETDSKRPVSIAMEEIAQGKVTYRKPEEKI